MVWKPCRRPWVPHTFHGNLDDLKLKCNLRCFFHLWYPASWNFERWNICIECFSITFAFPSHCQVVLRTPRASQSSWPASTHLPILQLYQACEGFCNCASSMYSPVLQCGFLSLNKCSTILPWFILFANLWSINIKGSHTYFVPVVFSPDAHCVRYAVIDSPIP